MSVIVERSAGTCEVVYKYDITYLGSSSLPLPSGGGRLPDTLYADNDDSIRAVVGHITQDEIFMTASEDGTIRRYDGRENTRVPRAQNVIQTSNEITDVKYHPTMEHLFLSSNGAGEVNLFDDRMAFTSSFNKSDDGIVQKYNTKITKRLATRFCHPEASSISFDRDGSKFAVSFMQYLPTIYSVSDPDPIAVLSGNNLPDGTPNPPGKRTYSNVCTMKHGSFGGPGLDVDDMYAAGSDDFRCYVWKIPPVSQLLNQREIISADDWNASERLETGRNEPRVVPVEIATPLCRLTGHDTIVNTAVFHPHLFHIVTSGVEKNIILHSPTPSSPCTQNLQRSPADVRELKPEDEDLDRANYLTALFGSHPTLLTESADDREERRTISLFDHILREEGDADVWTRRPWSMPGSDDDNEQEDEGSSDSASDDSDMDEIAFLPSFLT
ncbi:hypothetical protein D9613_005957 [Agrocybe pediades]|uniref:WD40 repeat-like protein n=1 Tax=Agrocybe pediades TaxID=84607 RepID=A0A8H4QUT3_9AGAR|nr:hypothetical protein D9613_005957 [Agrocybe pediades]